MRRALSILLLAVATPALADEVLLRGGGRLSGVVVERTPSRIVIETAPGRVTLPASRVERVVSSSSAIATYETRAESLAPGEIEGWLALGSWARSQGLQTRARAAFARVLEIDPDNTEAHAALGHVYVSGRWMTLTESYAARGLVEFEGAWLTPAERAGVLRARTEEALAARALAEADARVREAEARASAAEAEARRLEAEARAATPATGLPLWWAYSGGYGGIATPYAASGRTSRRHGSGGAVIGARSGRTGGRQAGSPRATPGSSLGASAAQSGSRPRSGGTSSLR
jgi:hypothetical protein